MLEAGDLRLDPAAHRLWRGDTPIALSPRQFSPLEFLLRPAGEALSKSAILDHVWDFALDGDPNIVEVYIRQLRRKIDEPGATPSRPSGSSATGSTPMAAEPRFRRRGTVRTHDRGRHPCVRSWRCGGTVMLSLLHRSLVRNLDDVADIRSDDIAALARRGTLPPTLSLEDDAVGQVVDDQGGVLAASANVSDRVPIAAIHPAVPSR